MSYPKTWTVGRRTASGVERVFDIERTSGGGVRLTNIYGLTDAERHVILAHFGTAAPMRSGGLEEGALVSTLHTPEVGSEDHFVNAVYLLPQPFELMGRR